MQRYQTLITCPQPQGLVPQGLVKLTPQNYLVASEVLALKHLHVTTDESWSHQALGLKIEQAMPTISSTAPAGCLTFRL